MIQVIMGLKGSGKTKKMIDSINEAVASAHGDVVCIEYGKKLTYDINYRVRLVDSKEYGICNLASNPAETSCGNEPNLMYFTSGTTGYPKIATHSHLYALGHFITARYWHNVDPNGIHLTISDTGWGKALWGKLYGCKLISNHICD